MWMISGVRFSAVPKSEVVRCVADAMGGREPLIQSLKLGPHASDELIHKAIEMELEHTADTPQEGEALKKILNENPEALCQIAKDIGDGIFAVIKGLPAEIERLYQENKPALEALAHKLKLAMAEGFNFFDLRATAKGSDQSFLNN